ncbi:MAG: NAD(P)/FAD-dependent oxidoreductase, partial [Arthrobacter sp.]
DYKHKNLGAVAGFGEWKGVANINLLGRIGLKGPLAWLAHRGYHGFAMPTVERKIRVISNWLWSFFLGRDTTQLMDLDNPRGAFVAAATPAATPAPKPAAAPASPSAEKPSAEKPTAETGKAASPETVSADSK